MKKKNAIMIADTRPALMGNILVQLNDTNKGLFDEALIYYDTITEKDKEVMSSIMPCRFIKFDYELPNEVKALPAFEKFSSLMFARYYMFDMLDEYETVTWIDTDVLITGSLQDVIEKAKINGMAANFEDPINKSYKTTDIVKTSFSMPINNYDMNRYNMSSGLITIADTLENYEKMTKWCFEKTIEYAEYLSLPDQGILNILIQEFNIDVASVGENGAYCFYPSYNRDASKAKIVHAWGARKFWKSWYLYNKFPDWKKYYEKWVSMGGSDFFGEIKPDISVVIPTYNTNVNYFKDVLEDLLVNQVQEHGFQYDNFEVILVVDGDKNEELIELLKKYNDPRIVLKISKERLGIAKSLNTGIKLAKADYIARIDDDDRIAPDRLFKQYKYLNTHKNIDLVTSNFAYFGDMNEERVSFEGEMCRAWGIFTCPFNHPTIMVRKSFLLDNDLLYDESRSHVEDWELWQRCFKKGMKVGSIPEVLYYHRWHNNSAGQNQKTIDMMRELVRLNFAELNVDLTEEDLKIVPIWQGKVTENQYKKLESIFNKALKNNAELKVYDQRCLEKVFDLRLYEAKTGTVKDIVIKKDKVIPNAQNQSKTIKQKILGPIYRPFKRVLYNIMAEAVNDSAQSISTESKKNNKEIRENLERRVESFKNQLNYLHDQLYDFEMRSTFIREFSEDNLYNQKKLILIGTSEHSNIGDAAITRGEYEFIRKYFSDYKLIEVSTYQFNDYLPYLENIINDDDVIFLHGGGNLGNKYLTEENVRRVVIDTFKNNKIVILPQTIHFDNDEELNKSKEIYNRHNNLILFTRGEKSLEFAKKNFPKVKIYKAIDMALNMHIDYNYERNGILCCIRDLSDESILTKEEYEKIFSIVKAHDANYDFTNNLNTEDIRKQIRNHVVYNQLKLFAKHKLVITDRLHGLIFCLITNTPCIVIRNHNHKINEFIEMLKDNKNICFIDKNIDLLESKITELLNSVPINTDYRDKFVEVAKIIKENK